MPDLTRIKAEDVAQSLYCTPDLPCLQGAPGQSIQEPNLRGCALPYCHSVAIHPNASHIIQPLSSPLVS